MSVLSSETNVPRLIGKTILAVAALLVVLGIAELILNRVRGYQLVTLKTRMYWDNGNAVAGEKVKTWKIAIPVDIWLGGNIQSWSLFTRVPIYSNRHEDFETSRYVDTLSIALPDNTLVASANGITAAVSFPLTFSNKIAGTARAGPDDYPPKSITNGCAVQQQHVNYHGWMVRVRPNKFRSNSATANVPLPEVSDERICAIVLKNLEQWTIHIDDLQSKDSGQ